MDVIEKIFKAYDIRGISPDELSPRIAKKVGIALGNFLAEGKVAVGRDMRSDSADLAQNLIDGLVLVGREVIDIGMVTSDMIYFAVGKYNLAGGAMITASHNPGEYNGIKLTGKGVSPIGENTGLKQIKEMILSNNLKLSNKVGKITKKDILNSWVDHALKFTKGNLSPLKVGIDCGNGMAGIVVKELSKKTNLKIEGLYLEPDGTFPNHPANPLDPANLEDLSKLVKQKKLDIGIAFDGDGDRAFLIDEKSNLVSASYLGALVAQDILREHPSSAILYSVICSRVVPETIEANGGEAIRTRVGHSFVKADMKNFSAMFAAEHSGHYYFKDNFSADSGLAMVLYVLGLMSRTGKKLSDLIMPFDKYFSSGEINSKVKDPSLLIKNLKSIFGDGNQDNLDGLSVYYDNWWFNVRPSNTEPFVRLNVESDNADLTKEKTKRLLEIIRK